ncbi:unnamed protein product [Symbiodinium microadriaticum]|nr:unnamed protein product [Symbiodinium microadriaticum]
MFDELVERTPLAVLRECGSLVELYWDPSLRRSRTKRRRRKARVGFFTVHEKGGAQRLIVDARQANACHRSPPTTRLATPAGMINLDLSAQTLEADGYGGTFGDPEISAEAGDVGDCFYNFQAPLDENERVYAAFGGIPMGWSWVLYVSNEIVSQKKFATVDLVLGFFLDTPWLANMWTTCTPLEVDGAWQLWFATRGLLRRGRISGQLLRVYLGLASFHFQLMRPALSIFSACYHFAAENIGRRRPVWPSVREESRFLVEYDMSAPFCEEVHIGDSSDKGCGYRHAELRRHRERWRFITVEEPDTRPIPQAVAEAGMRVLPDIEIAKGQGGAQLVTTSSSLPELVKKKFKETHEDTNGEFLLEARRYLRTHPVVFGNFTARDLANLVGYFGVSEFASGQHLVAQETHQSSHYSGRALPTRLQLRTLKVTQNTHRHVQDFEAWARSKGLRVHSINLDRTVVRYMTQLALEDAVPCSRRPEPTSSLLKLKRTGPKEFVYDFANLALDEQQLEIAFAMIIQLDSYLRPSEGLGLRRTHIGFPAGGRYNEWSIAVAPFDLGTATKTGKYDDSVLVADKLDRAWLTEAMKLYMTKATDKLFPSLTLAKYEGVSPRTSQDTGRDPLDVAQRWAALLKDTGQDPPDVAQRWAALLKA